MTIEHVCNLLKDERVDEACAYVRTHRHALVGAVTRVDRRTLLHEAAEIEGSAPLMKQMLDLGANPAAVDVTGRTALHEACIADNAPAVRLLLKPVYKSADVVLEDMRDCKGRTALVHACDSGHTKIVHLLLESFADVTIANRIGATALHFAAVGGCTDIVRLLLQYGARKNAVSPLITKTPLMMAAERGHAETARVLLEAGAHAGRIEGTPASPLHYAAKGGHLHVCELLLASGKTAVDVDARCSTNSTPLHWASQKNRAAVIAFLVERGADPNAEAGRRNGHTALHVAASHNCLEAARALVKCGADARACSPGIKHATPLHYACRFGVELCQLLIDAGADVEAGGHFGMLPIHVAAARSDEGSGPVIRALVAAGADPDGMYDGSTALYRCAGFGQLDTVRVLLDAGASPATLNRTDTPGVWYTPLCAALCNSRVAVMRELLLHGADHTRLVVHEDGRVGVPEIACCLPDASRVLEMWGRGTHPAQLRRAAAIKCLMRVSCPEPIPVDVISVCAGFLCPAPPKQATRRAPDSADATAHRVPGRPRRFRRKLQ